MKKSIFSPFTGIALGLGFLYAISVLSQKNEKMITPFKTDYASLWNKVDSLNGKGLPKSALEVVNKLYEKAKAENNTGQFVKAVIHRLKFTSYTEEDAFVLSLIDLDKEAAKAEFPAKQVLHSMLAEMYWSYYQQNRYRFLQRTTTENFAPSRPT